MPDLPSPGDLPETVRKIGSKLFATPLARVVWWWEELFPDKPFSTHNLINYLCAKHDYTTYEANKLSSDEIAEILRRDVEERTEKFQSLRYAKPVANDAKQDQLDPRDYWSGKSILERYPELVTDYTTLRRLLQKHSEVRTHKPSKHRLMVHPADFERLAQRLKSADPLDKEDKIADVQERKDAVRAKKSLERPLD